MGDDVRSCNELELGIDRLLRPGRSCLVGATTVAGAGPLEPPLSISEIKRLDLKLRSKSTRLRVVRQRLPQSHQT